METPREESQAQPQRPEPAEAPAPRQRPVRQRPSRHKGAVDRVRDVHFPLALRGYDRTAVDAHLAEVAQLVAELEATQLRENVVQRALDEVGEQTSSVLQHAHDTAEEITARSRSQAEGASSAPSTRPRWCAARRSSTPSGWPPTQSASPRNAGG